MIARSRCETPVRQMIPAAQHGHAKLARPVSRPHTCAFIRSASFRQLSCVG
jgi:hypothetical protein